VRNHRHCRNRREVGDPIRPVSLDCVHLSRRDHLYGFGPGDANQSALAAGLVIAATTFRVVDHVSPGQHRITQPLLGLPIHLKEDTARVRISDPRRGVGVPGESSTSGAATRLVFRPVGTDRGVVGLLGLPGNDAVADVDLPGTRTGAVHAVRGPHHLVVTPPISVKHIAGPAAFSEGHSAVVRFLPSSEEPAQLQERIGGLAVDPGGDRRIHMRTLTIGARAAEVTKVPWGFCVLAFTRWHPYYSLIWLCRWHCQWGRTDSLRSPTSVYLGRLVLPVQRHSRAPIAQQAERLHGKEKVCGSIPHGGSDSVSDATAHRRNMRSS
jgi:hypothetical protein